MTAAADTVALDAKLRFLCSASAHPGLSAPPDCVETHMSWLFFAGDHVLKLKKPVRFAYLDFSTLGAREFDCREELRLNSRLAPGVYLGLLALQAGPAGLALVPEQRLPAPGQTVDWLVQMRRLPAQHNLLDLIAQARVEPAEIDALVAVLAAFYRHAPTTGLTAAQYLAQLQRGQADNHAVLLWPPSQLRDAARALARFDAKLLDHAALLGARARSGKVVEGHGDLRPEHVWLLTPPVVIDCLEFNAQLRQVDPFDEIAFLALECDMAGAPWIAAHLQEGCSIALADRPGAALWWLYTANAALRRARLAMAHLLDAVPRTPAKWPPRAQRYIERAQIALDALDAHDAVSAATNRDTP